MIETVFLDMDGTLLDRHFDDYFWEHYVPEVYAERFNMDRRAARKMLLEKYRKREGTLDWTDLDYWTENLGLDIPALKIKIEHLIQVHPYVVDFLEFVRSIAKEIYLITNAHSKTLQIKMAKTQIGHYFDRIVCAEEVGRPKEDVAFWTDLQRIVPYEKTATLLAEDNEKILHSAAASGIQHLIFVAKPSSTLPIIPSKNFPSIVTFNELIPG